MAEVFIDRNTDTVYVKRDNGDFVVIGPDSDPVTTFNIPGAASPMVNEDDFSSEAYDEGYDAGYQDGESASYSSDDLDDEYQRGYDEGKSAGYDEGYDEGLATAESRSED